jgi:hypothetical protein
MLLGGTALRLVRLVILNEPLTGIFKVAWLGSSLAVYEAASLAGDGTKLQLSFHLYCSASV